MVRGLIAAYPDLDDDVFVLARQLNLETIHQHAVSAERQGLLGEIREELASGRHSRRHVTMREWLELAA
jgi:GTP cyclohydrolase IV